MPHCIIIKVSPKTCYQVLNTNFEEALKKMLLLPIGMKSGYIGFGSPIGDFQILGHEDGKAANSTNWENCVNILDEGAN